MDFVWIKEFTALIQLISAVNFAYIFTHFAERVYTRIFNEEEIINKKFSSFKNGQLAKVGESIEHMNPIVINGTNTQSYIDHLKTQYEIIVKKWDEAKRKSEDIIKKIKKVKGIKCLFLYISVYCIVDMLNIALINVVNICFFQNFTYLTNVISFIFSVIITYKILLSKWQEEDIFCYNQTRKYIVYTLIICLVLTSFNEIWIACKGVEMNISTPFAITMLIPCIYLPLYPCSFSVFYIFGNIFYVYIFRNVIKLKIILDLWRLNKKKRKLENAVSTITSGLEWK